MKLLIYFLSITSLYAQCGFLAGTVTEVSSSKSLAASISAKIGQTRLKMGKTSEKGIFSAEIPCGSNMITVESKGYQALSIPLHLESQEQATYFVSLELLPIGKQMNDEPYAQSEQTHFVLNDSTNMEAVVRRIEVADAVSGEKLQANVCLYYTHKQLKECFDLTRSDPSVEIEFQEKDIVAVEIKSPGYQSYHANLILDRTQDSTRTYTIKLNKQQTILSVNVTNAHAGLQCRLLEESGEQIILEKVNETHFFGKAYPGKSYKFEIVGRDQNVELSTAIASLQEGITLRSFKMPVPDSVKIDKPMAAANFKISDRTLYFPQSDYKLPAVSRGYLDSLATWIKSNSDKGLRISGHTDNVGNPQINLTLSDYRVRVISRYLVGKGVSEKAITAVGLGSKYPVSPNDTEKNRRLNRRVEVQIIDLQEKRN